MLKYASLTTLRKAPFYQSADQPSVRKQNHTPDCYSLELLFFELQHSLHPPYGKVLTKRQGSGGWSKGGPGAVLIQQALCGKDPPRDTL